MSQQLQSCINDCKQIINELQTLSSSTNDPRIKTTLAEAAHHLEMCFHECAFAAKEIP